MGIFSLPFGNKDKSSSAVATPPASQQPSGGSATQAAPAKPVTVEVRSEPAAAPKVAVKGWKFVFFPNITDASKVEYWIKKLIHVVNYEWQYAEAHAPKLQGRVGWRSDHKKIQLEVKGSQKDVDKLLAWCKLDHLGVKVKDAYVEKYSYDSMSHSGLFARKDGMS